MSKRAAQSWLSGRARALRLEMTPPERAVWEILRDGELRALNWRRQAPMGRYVADFVSHPARLVVEVDGAQHAEVTQVKHDAVRTAWFEEQGYRVIRVWNDEAIRDKDGVWLTIHAFARQTSAAARMERWRSVHVQAVRMNNTRIASSSVEEAPRSGGGGAPSVIRGKPPEALSSGTSGSPPQSVACATDSSPIEGERGVTQGEA